MTITKLSALFRTIGMFLKGSTKTLSPITSHTENHFTISPHPYVTNSSSINFIIVLIGFQFFRLLATTFYGINAAGCILRLLRRTSRTLLL